MGNTSDQEKDVQSEHSLHYNENNFKLWRLFGFRALFTYSAKTDENASMCLRLRLVSEIALQVSIKFGT
jgi:hypothetical protein